MTETLKELIDRTTERLCSMNCDAESSCLCSAHQFRSALAGIARPQSLNGFANDVARDIDKIVPLELEQIGPIVGVLEDALTKWAAAGIAPPSLQEQGWQPIETAPKDGRWVILAERIPPTGSDLYIHPNSRERVSVTVGRFALTSDPEGGREWHRYGVGSINGQLLTHWMPLPLPPPSAKG